MEDLENFPEIQDIGEHVTKMRKTETDIMKVQKTEDEITNEDIDKSYFIFNLKCLYYFGVPVIPYKKTFLSRWFYRLYTVTVLSVFFYGFCVAEIVGIFSADNSTLAIAIAHVFQHNLASAKISLIIYGRKRIWEYMESFRKNECAPSMERGGIAEFEYVKKASKFSKIFAVRSQLLYATLLILLAVHIIRHALTPVPVLNEETNLTEYRYFRRLPLDSYFPLKVEGNILNYILGFTHQYGCMLIFLMYISTADSLFCAVMMQIHAQYKILKNSLDTYLERAVEAYNREDESDDHIRLDKNTDFELHDAPKSFKPYTFGIINQCVKHHHRIISMSEEAEDIFRYITFLQILASLMIVCFTMLQVSTLELFGFAWLSSTLFLVAMIYQIYIYCYTGDQVREISDMLTSYIYSTKWLAVDRNQKIYLLLMMMRTQRPFRFTAGKFVYLSMPTFMAIVKTGASYFAVLNSLKKT